jgi:hypothetical protein
MADVSTMFDCFGIPLDELPVLVERSWNVERSVNTAKGSFSMPYDHPKATIRNLLNGNIILVQSSEAGVRDWAALIAEPEPDGTELIDGELIIKLRSSEYLLGTRYTASQDILSGKPGEVFAALIYIARREGFLPISTDMSGIDTGGNLIGPIEYNDANIFNAVNDLAANNDAYWWFQPVIDSTGRLTLKPYWVYKRSRQFPVPLKSAGVNSNFIIRRVRQAAEVANHVKAFASTDNWANPIEYEEFRYDSIGYYKGVRTYVIPALEETTQAGLIPLVQDHIRKNAFSPIAIEGVVVQAPYPQAGDVLYVVTDNLGPVITNRRGPIIQMTMQSGAWSPADEVLSVILNEVIPDESK